MALTKRRLREEFVIKALETPRPTRRNHGAMNYSANRERLRGCSRPGGLRQGSNIYDPISLSLTAEEQALTNGETRKKKELMKEAKQKRAVRRQNLLGVLPRDLEPKVSKGETGLINSLHPARSTQMNYLKLLAAFSEYAELHKLDVSSFEGLDRGLCDYADFLFLGGEQGDMGTKLWAAVRHKFPEVGKASANRLPLFLKAVRGWMRLAPGETRDPMPETLAAGIEAALIELGYKMEAFYVAVCFEGYLRGGEALPLLWRDVVPPAPKLAEALKYWSVRVCSDKDGRPTKAGIFDDTVTYDLVSHEFIGQVFAKLRKKHSGSDRIFPFSGAQLRARWLKALQLLNLEGLGFTPHSLRHGGATRDVQRKLRSSMDVLKRGRWKSSGMLDRYAKPGRLQAVLERVPGDTVAFCENAFLNRARMHLGLSWPASSLPKRQAGHAGR